MKKNKIEKIIVILLFIIAFIISAYFNNEGNNNVKSNISYEISNIPEYNGQPYIELYNNNPKFSDEDMSLDEEYYSKLKFNVYIYNVQDGISIDYLTGKSEEAKD